jgi:BCCT family betaine/carnitine transporter
VKLNQTVDWPGFGAAVATIVLTCVPLVLFPESGGKVVQTVYDSIAQNLSFLYLLAGSGVFLLMMWLALGKYGKVRLACGDELPEFSDFSWAAMLFCTGVGAGLLFWAPLEWAFYFDGPPYGVEPRSMAAAEWASTYGVFHWGPTAWCFYALPTLAIAYPYYVKRVPFLRLSTSCHYFFGGEIRTKRERLIDWFFMIGILGGAGSSLGFSTPMIAALVARVTGVEASFALEMGVVVVSVALFAASVWLGLHRGIKRLSDLNMWLAMILIAFILIVGPTVFLFKTSINSLGIMAQNFIRMNTWTDPFTDSNFVESWTVFYWAWWIAFGPFVGLFVTRISRGRSIRQVIFGMLGYGTLGGALFYMVLGNFGLQLQVQEGLAITEVLSESGGPAAIVLILDQLPLATLVAAVYALIALVFSATTYDSASYILASSGTRRLPAGEDPARWHRVFWAVMLAILPVTLIFIGGLKVAQTATLIVSLPLIFVGVIMAVALVRQLQVDHPKAGTHRLMENPPN